MLRKPLVFCFFLLFFHATFAFQFPAKLSRHSQISLLTGTPGEALYSTFGHSAIRVHDETQNFDIVFNYGTFDFNTPNFYWKFMRGKLLYMLSVEEFEQFRLGFVYEGRGISEQIFNLNQEQKQAVYTALLKNYSPENRYYKYDFFYDNCATRIRDLFEDVLGESLIFNYPSSWKVGRDSFRDLIDIYLVNHPWSDFGIDLCLGMPTDKIARPEDYMFLPDFLAEAFSQAVISNEDDQQKLVLKPNVLLEGGKRNYKRSSFIPMSMGWGLLLLVLVVSLIGFRTGKKYKVLDKLLFSICGLLGWLIVFLWFFTDHVATKDNLNILWNLPLSFPLVLILLNNQATIWIKRYFGLVFVLLLLLLAFWPLNPQSFNHASIPIMLALMLRAFLMLFGRFSNWGTNNFK